MTDTLHNIAESVSDGIKIEKKTLWISLGLAISLAISTAAGAVWLNTRLQSIDYRLETLNTEIRTFNSKVDEKASHLEDKWRAWVKLFKAQNPALSIPEFDIR